MMVTITFLKKVYFLKKVGVTNLLTTPEPDRATQNHPEPARATQESPRASQSQPEAARANQSQVRANENLI